MRTLISFEEAQAAVLEAVPTLAVEQVSLAEALGRTLAAPVISREEIPPFPNASMDGFAVRSADLAHLPCTLRIIEEIPAGRLPEKTVVPQTCSRIMTGAPFPAGADAVAPVEWTEAVSAEVVRILRVAAPGLNVRPAGQDVRVGEVVLASGTVVTPPVVGMLATLGYARVEVRHAPRVAVVATGDELVDVSATPGPGQLRNANGPALAAQAHQAGGLALPPLLARDDRASLEAALTRALEAEVLVFSGGVSMGTHDLVRTVLEDRGLRWRFWQVRQRPGKPLAFGMLDGKPVFGLPGNPVSSAVCFEQYVRPALAVMLGRHPVLPQRYPARLSAATPKVRGLHYFTRGVARVEADGSWWVQDTGPQASNLYSSMVRANCLVHLPEDLEDPPAGAQVLLERLPWQGML